MATKTSSSLLAYAVYTGRAKK